MTAVPILPDLTRVTTYNPVASAGPFDVGFAVYGEGTDYGAWVRVYLDGVELQPGTAWVLTSPTGPLETLARPIEDAQVTLLAAATGTLKIVGTLRPRRTVQLNEGRALSARDFNQAVTKIAATQRELYDRINEFESLLGADFGDPLVAAAAVLTDRVQSFTTAQKAQGRNNIGLVDQIKTATYAVTNDDKGTRLRLGGNIQFDVNLGAASTYDADFEIILENVDKYTGAGSGRGKIIKPSGGAQFRLYPEQRCRLRVYNNAWVIHKPSRWKCTPSVQTIVYVDPAGSDTNNDGLAAGATGAYATIGQAVADVMRFFDETIDEITGLANVTVQLAYGTNSVPVVHNGNLHLSGPFMGSRGLRGMKIVGAPDVANNRASVLNATGVSAISIHLGAVLHCANFSVAASGVNSAGLESFRGAFLSHSGMDFGVCGFAHILQNVGGKVEELNPNGATISGAAPYHMILSGASVARVVSITRKFLIDVAFTKFIVVGENSTCNWQQSTIDLNGKTVTGTRAEVFNGGQLYSGDGTTTFFPGNAAVSILPGGSYDSSSLAPANAGTGFQIVNDKIEFALNSITQDTKPNIVPSSDYLIRDRAGTVRRLTLEDILGFFYGIGGPVSGRYHAGLAISAYNSASVTLTANQLYWMPLILPARATWTKIGIDVTTAAGSNARLGVYKMDATGVPGTLVFDAGTVSTASTGVKEITISQALEVGAYAAAIVCDGGPAVRAGLLNGTMIGALGVSAPGTADYLMSRAFAYAALPNPWGGTPGGTTGSPPLIWLRK